MSRQRNHSDGKGRHIPMRRCIGCQQSFPQDQLMRFTMDGTKIIPDMPPAAIRPAETEEATIRTERPVRPLRPIRNEGRGLYLCRDQKCIDRAIKRKAFNRVLRVQADMESVTRAIETALKTN